VYPNTPTLSFYKSSYTSQYLDFQPVEWQGPTQGSILQEPTAAQKALFSKYDAPPYIASGSAGAFPFVDIGNKYLVLGAQYMPSVLAGLSWNQVADDIRNPASPVAKAIDGTANSITAAICKIAPNAPTSVCNSQAVLAGSGAL
jgi:hypothetical protein